MNNRLPTICSFILTAILLAMVQLMAKSPLLLAERLWPGAGWIQILLFAFYSGVLTQKFLDPSQARQLRPKIWLFFSFIFFTQLLIGLAGFEKFLMTGKLHLPIPALILAGPIYRGADFFMPLLLLITLLLVGPAWCSHLCYIGAWEDSLSRRAGKHSQLPPWRGKFRFFMLLLLVVMAFSLRYLGVSSTIAFSLALVFGLVGVGIMLLISRKNGAMNHCLAYCPIGLVANLLGRLSPFRIRIGNDCSKCSACSKVCKYEALSLKDLANRRPALTCTLCGDCLSACRSRQINYHLPFVSTGFAHKAFVILIITLHSLFLAVARI